MSILAFNTLIWLEAIFHCRAYAGTTQSINLILCSSKFIVDRSTYLVTNNLANSNINCLDFPLSLMLRWNPNFIFKRNYLGSFFCSNSGTGPACPITYGIDSNANTSASNSFSEDLKLLLNHAFFVELPQYGHGLGLAQLAFVYFPNKSQLLLSLVKDSLR